MPRHPDAIIERNQILSDARMRLPSPTRKSQPVSRGELADAVNAALDRLYPDTAKELRVDARWIGKLERGEHRWPGEERRAALRAALEADSDAALGLFNPRRTDDQSNVNAGRFPFKAKVQVKLKPPAQIDTSVAHPARRYDYWLGGKDNFAADRKSADAIEARFPGMRAGIRANRDVLRRMTEFLTAEAGIRQFLDIGTGLPTVDNTHEVAQRIAPESRVLYVDNDPLVMAHARALLTSSSEGFTDYIEADLRQPEAILAAARDRDRLNLSEPVALMLIAVLHFIPPGKGQAQAIVRQLVNELPAGSYVAATHFTVDFMPPEEKIRYQQLLDAGISDIWPRDEAAFSAPFGGLDLVDPGITLVNQWRRGAGADDIDPSRISVRGAVWRKP
ncbi:hypothetical protein GCM10020358_49500 [Amorphoplanes nipponensis]|uniref:S-adenosyl methyltransferase n=1 Tax=Actinoplanes nipponensis TaxID=135950 RepID=A0A919JPK5_9ACTN|nr:SAM-dependent methyltransferase [Actinoplanes nipponensis]GIE53125.1 hypothetical protein Ani05nite_66590 [Actinoplanes nipponensis]